MRKSVLFLILIMCFASVYAAEKDRLTVMDVTDETGMLDEKTIINVTDYIFTRFQGTGSFWMIPKSDRDTALDKAIEETKLNSRKECVDEKCQLSLVAELQANFLINTKIKKLYEGTCQISISKFDVEKRAGVFSWDKRFDCSNKGIFDAIDGFNLKKINEIEDNTQNPKDKYVFAQKIKNDYNWSKKSQKLMNWNDGVKYCDKLVEKGYSDWRMPTISELKTLIQNCQATETNGACNVSDACLSFKCVSDSCSGCNGSSDGKYSKFGDTEFLWTFSELSNSEDIAWYVNFHNGYLGSKYKDMGLFNIRCVRE